jgi:plasmid maintenance system antidote protein VapI
MAKTKLSIRELAEEIGVSTSRLKEILAELGVDEREWKQGLDEETAQLVKEMARELVGDLKTLVLPRELTVRDLAEAMERAPHRNPEAHHGQARQAGDPRAEVRP